MAWTGLDRDFLQLSGRDVEDEPAQRGVQGDERTGLDPPQRLADVLLDIAAPLPLSRREREIATLVRDGLSNKEIADTLTMSVRTVEGHILRACKKVEVANRAALGELINQFMQ